MGKPLRTLNSLKSLAISSGGDKKAAKDFASCLNQPLLDSSTPDEPLLYRKISLPALHLSLSVNTFLRNLCKVWPELTGFLSGIGIQFESYHGGQCLEGNEVKRLAT